MVTKAKTHIFAPKSDVFAVGPLLIAPERPPRQHLGLPCAGGESQTRVFFHEKNFEVPAGYPKVLLLSYFFILQVPIDGDLLADGDGLSAAEQVH